MVQAVSRRPLTAEDRFRSQVNPCAICGGPSGIRRGFSPTTLAFSVSIIAPMLHNFPVSNIAPMLHNFPVSIIAPMLHNFPVSVIAPMLRNHRLHIARTGSMGTFQKAALFFGSRGSMGRKVPSLSLWPVTTEDRGRSQAISCEIYGAQSGTGTGFSPCSLKD